MDVIIKGRSIDVTPALREYAEEKILKMAKFVEPMVKVEIEMTVQKNPSIRNNQTIEVTVFAKKAVIRAKKSAVDMYSAIDLVTKKLERQLEKYKSKLYTSNNKHGERAVTAASRETRRKETRSPGIVKKKHFAVKPMTPEEAGMQMDLLGHDFYVFVNSETDEPNVIYRRRDGNYGLIEPQLKP